MGSLTDKIAKHHDIEEFHELTWAGTFEDYLNIVREDPRVARTAWQRLYDMIMSYGSTEYTDSRKKMRSYHFFDDPIGKGADAVFGMDVTVMKLVNTFKSAAHGYGTDKRIILLHGPVGSAKSTVARLLKKGLETYSRTSEGALYTFDWIMDLEDEDSVCACPLHEDPLHLIPMAWREKAVEEMGLNAEDSEYRIPIKGELDPACELRFNILLKQYDGDWAQVMKHVRVRRFVFDEANRVGIGTFQPKDEKNQDSTELTGDINYRLIAEYGSDSDPRAFNFDGEFCVANRGLIEFVEVLKLDVAFLYDLLGATQEHKIKPKKFPQVDIDEVIIGHTNEAEYQRLLNNEYMEALRDRTIKIDVPYITKPSLEVEIYKKDFGPTSDRIRGIHVAPHTLEVAAMWYKNEKAATLLVLPDDLFPLTITHVRFYGAVGAGYNVRVYDVLGGLPSDGLDSGLGGASGTGIGGLTTLELDEPVILNQPQSFYLSLQGQTDLQPLYGDGDGQSTTNLAKACVFLCLLGPPAWQQLDGLGSPFSSMGDIILDAGTATGADGETTCP